jgi:hypothetical protein
LWIRRLLRTLACSPKMAVPMCLCANMVPLAQDIVTWLCPAIHQAVTILATGSKARATSAGSLPPHLSGRVLKGGGSSLPAGPLACWAAGFHALVPVSDMRVKTLPIGDWCVTVPLWGHPLLQLELPQKARTVHWATSGPSPGRPLGHRLGDLWAIAWATSGPSPGLHATLSWWVLQGLGFRPAHPSKPGSSPTDPWQA